MNRNGYYVDFIGNTVTVSKKFLMKASEIGSPSYKTMMKLRALGMPIVQEKRKKPKRAAKLSYQKMRHYITCLADAQTYLLQFEAARNASRGEKDPYGYMLNWFEDTFPNHAAVPEFDENYRIVNTPANYANNA
ncbi:MAG: hypothetical protein J6K13_05220 [Clostridia bacterium]|nr:hypothetical protein [Clostridia bacterium]